MSDHQEWAGNFEEASDFDLADSAEENGEEDPEDSVGREEGEVPAEADAADAVDQAWEVPADDDDEARPG